ncbi:hypothetical protein QF042_001731 [Pedobacter sp. W3I1]|uniref:8-oxoguanine DNA glycosylase OGG fold protein n=1 Tax=Pedobacter sp. W3I1 TaxID=3042291 RepID=UPI002789CAA1|nr:hypothetical protein [Pedobacter sp. W3I1]MDQ0638166.1 hypothetical protein [Pedobacter sp. W3I1]
MISLYAGLIKELPVRDIFFSTKRSTWVKAEKEIPWLKLLNDDVFGLDYTLSISRSDIFRSISNVRKRIILTIYWGYPQGMRGKHFINILKSIEIIEESISTMRNIESPTTDDHWVLMDRLKSVKGLALSTISKLLYFFEIKINGHECQILDLRLIDALSSKSFSQYENLLPISYGATAEKKYPLFLELTTSIANKLECKPENIEMFLFTFGKNLKSN